MQVFCERFLRFLAGEDPDSVVCDCSRGGPGVADEVRNPDTPVAVPEQVQTRSLRNYRLQLRLSGPDAQPHTVAGYEASGEPYETTAPELDRECSAIA